MAMMMMMMTLTISSVARGSMPGRFQFPRDGNLLHRLKQVLCVV